VDCTFKKDGCPKQEIELNAMKPAKNAALRFRDGAGHETNAMMTRSKASPVPLPPRRS
jgi:hypothetical protein